MIFYFFAILGVVIFYVLSPYDIIPDTLGLIGFTDDISVVGFFAIWVIGRFYQRFRDRNEQDFHNIESE